MNHPTKTIILALSFALAAVRGSSGQQGFFYERGTNSLYALDLDRGTETLVGSLGTLTGSLTRLGWRRDAQTLWAAMDTGVIGEVDPTTGRFTPTYQTGIPSLVDVDWDVRQQVFYCKGPTGNLFTFEPQSRTTTDLGTFNPLGPYGEQLATDGHGTLWCYDNLVYGTLTVIDVARRTYTKLATPDTDLIQSITIHDKTWEMYATIGENQPRRRTPGVYRLDPATGQTSLVHAFQRPSALPCAFELAEFPDAFCQVNRNTRSLHSVDFASGRTFEIGTNTRLGDLTWRADTQELWCLDEGGELGTVDRFTGLFYVQASLRDSSTYRAIAWDAPSQRFYIATIDELRTFDPRTATLTTLRTDMPEFWSLDTAPDGTLWGLAQGGDPYTIDKSTGVATRASVRFGRQMEACAFSPELGEIYATARNSRTLYRGDLHTGQLVEVMSLYPGWGLEIVSMPSTGSYLRVGKGCRDATNTEVNLLLTGEPDIARSFDARIHQGGAQPYLLCFGVSDTTWNGVGLPFSLSALGSAPNCLVRASLDLMIGPLQASGFLPIVVPDAPELVGARTFCQALVLDARLAGPGIATSDMITVTIGR
ncbi:MAG: hypothetical protein R3F56_23745 [Planctomycetota bacterium]